MIPVLPLRLAFTLKQATRLPRYPGSLWRSALGANLRHHTCITGAATCDGCHLLQRCGYGFLFDTPQPTDPAGLAAQYPDLPHPYVISPHSPGGDYSAGDTVAVDITLIDPGHHFLTELLAAARTMRLGRAALQLDAVELRPPVGGNQTSETTTGAAALEAHPRMPEPPPAPTAARIDFQHPLRLRRYNRYLQPQDFDFGTFFTTLMRRICMLQALTRSRPIDADTRGLAAHARSIDWQASQLRWQDWSRKSARQKRRIPMGGIVGSIQLSGEIAPLWPWLWAGQWLHVGKGAVMGLGRYRIQTV